MPSDAPTLFFGKPWPITSRTDAVVRSQTPHAPDFQGPFRLERFIGRPDEFYVLNIEPEGEDSTDSTVVSADVLAKRLAASERAADPVIAHFEPGGGVTWISFQMDGKLFHGWLGCNPFRPGDELELIAAHEKAECYRLYALARPADRLITLMPGCTQGRLPYVRKTLQFLLVVLALLISIPSALFALMADAETGLATLRIMLIIGGVLSLLALFKFFQLMHFEEFSEQIFHAIGIPNEKRVDLSARTRKTPLDCAASQIMTEAEWQQLPRPSRRAVTEIGYGVNYFRY